jgi:ketosteroid isomerase-like protein
MTAEAPAFELYLKKTLGKGSVEVAQRNRQTIERVYRAIEAGDQAALFGILADDVVFHEAASLPYGCTKTGKDGALAGVEGMFSAWSHLRVDIEEFATAGDIVIAYLNMRGTARATGQVYEGPTAELFRFKDGKVIEWRPIYWDTHRVRQVCGLA